ncbi:unnamed protein product, partial [Discosporangium mesarthrocarpum]
MKSYLFSLLGTFCPYKYSAWKRAIREQCAKDCRPLSPGQRGMYTRAYGTWRAEKRLSRAGKKARLAQLEALEARMTYQEMMWLRKEARGWSLSGMGEEPPPDAPLDPDMMEGVDEGHPQFDDICAFAARTQGLKLAAWEISTCLREILVETVVLRRLEVQLLQKGIEERDGPENKAFRTPQQAVYLVSRLEARFRLFISRTKASNRLHSRGANGIDGEPLLPWLMAGGTMEHPVLLDEATGVRFGYGSSCLLSPTEALEGSGKERGAGGGAGAGAEAGAGAGAGAGRDTEAAGTAEVPAISGTFKMWSDYRMSIEGQAQGVQVAILFAPLMEAIRVVADSFRRRWGSGGAYPVLELARVRLAETGGRYGDGEVVGEEV